MPFLAENENDVGEVALACRGDNIGRARPLAAHAHVERPVVPEGKSALRRCRAASRRRRGRARRHRRRRSLQSCATASRLEKRSSNQRQPALRSHLRQAPARARARLASRSMADHLAVRGGKNGAGVAAGAEGRVDIDAAVTDIEEIECGAAEHGNVAGWSASDSRKAAAAHRHSRAPSALRAAVWDPSSPLSARTFWVASASSLRKRPGSQI